MEFLVKVSEQPFPSLAMRILSMDFNLTSYRQLLEYANELEFGFKSEEFTKSILLQHDVDLDLASCMEMAIIESETHVGYSKHMINWCKS